MLENSVGGRMAPVEECFDKTVRKIVQEAAFSKYHIRQHIHSQRCVNSLIN